MEISVFLGAALVLLGGILLGVFALPMKYARQWGFEHIWLVFALTGFILFPWLLNLATIPRLDEIYAAAPTRSLWMIVLFGFGWGIGATLVGLGVKMLGIGLGLAIILGICASAGSLVPLLILTPQKIFTTQGYFYLIGSMVMFGGIAGVAVAGLLRERAERLLKGEQSPGSSQKAFLSGLLVCIAAGLLSSFLNFAYAFGTETIETARRLGTSPVWAPNVAAALATSGGFVANAIYCIYLLRRNGTASRFRLPGTASHWLFGLLMGGFWYGGLAIYGMGINRMGDFGTVVGWPLLMGTNIIASNVAGLATGEWDSAGARAKAWLAWGCLIILAAVVVLALAQKP